MQADVHMHYVTGHELGLMQRASDVEPTDSRLGLRGIAAARVGRIMTLTKAEDDKSDRYCDGYSSACGAGSSSQGVALNEKMEVDDNSPPSLHKAAARIKIEKPDCEVPLSSLNSHTADSFASELSDLSSPESSFSSKATTPAEIDTPKKRISDLSIPAAPRRSCSDEVNRLDFIVQPKSSIPKDISSAQYANECIIAAENSRLNPFALHTEEYHLLRRHISFAQVTTYLNIRNGILRLWLQRPWVAISRKEAIGCANTRWFDAANLCYDWLVRRGYINFGCLDLTRAATESKQGAKTSKRRKIVVVGAGVSGLSCARQLEGLFQQYASRFNDMGEASPKVVLIEGRSRVGGRVHSREFRTKPSTFMPGFHQRRCAADMGGMIITGFDRGNPMNILVRGQLGLAYHALKAETTIYDSDGKPVDAERDELIEKLYNDCLDRVSEHKYKMAPNKVVEGNRDLIVEAKDSPTDGSKTIAQKENAAASIANAQLISQQKVGDTEATVPVSSKQLMNSIHHANKGDSGVQTASERAISMGWALKNNIDKKQDLSLTDAVNQPHATLGSVLDDAISQYKPIVNLNALDHRLINWHIANLEYSNATNLYNLSLALWDFDAGNEWDGRHTMVVGGYQSVARGLLCCPSPLDITVKCPVRKIRYQTGSFTGPASIECENGDVIEADAVVCTVPLGVLKHDTIEFDPPVPQWKSKAIERLGFGVLNKVVLVYEKIFWESDRHIFGVLRDASDAQSTSQSEYRCNRGRFFQWFNITNTAGLPCLMALMAGDAGFDTERTSNEDLVHEATDTLRSIFGHDTPYPVEAIVTRWGSDPFARGSYSSAAPEMQPEDYDNMAKPLGNLFFAGEHTIGTHPATVHGAFLSGLRAASEILEEILGPIEVPTPLILPRDSLLLHKRKEAAKDPRQARIDAYDAEAWDYVRSKIGDRPALPAKLTANAYILFSKANFDEARRRCEEIRKGGRARTRAMPNEVRVMTSRMWKAASDETRRPFEERAAEQRLASAEAKARYKAATEKWDLEAMEIRAAFERRNPPLEAELLADGSSTSAGSRMPPTSKSRRA